MSRLFVVLLFTFIVSGCASSRMATELKSVGFEWVDVDGGSFRMGDTFFDNPDAQPVHPVNVAPFRISRYETTLEQYDWYSSSTGKETLFPDQKSRGRRAVSNVNWNDAKAFCEYIGGRLPSEVEWEFAAAGGQLKQMYPGTDIEEEAEEYVRYISNSFAEVFPVGTKEPNALGLYDMGGNVAEWIGEFYEYYPEPGVSPNPFDLENRELRIVRGGGFSADLAVTRTYWRSGTLARVETPGIGMRCVQDR
jgi:sulfatase modifying factor 1